MTDVGAHDGSIEPGADLDANLDPDPDGGPHPPTPDTADGAIAGAPEPEPTPEGPVPTELAPTPLEVLRLSPEQWRIVAVASVEMTLPNANPMVVLHEAQDPWRELCIPVGLAEGTAIAYAYRGIETHAP